MAPRKEVILMGEVFGMQVFQVGMDASHSMVIDLMPNIDVVEEGVEVECGIGCFSPFEV
jgi:hypothetical protein